jgi:hypothetical protein
LGARPIRRGLEAAGSGVAKRLLLAQSGYAYHRPSCIAANIANQAVVRRRECDDSKNHQGVYTDRPCLCHCTGKLWRGARPRCASPCPHLATDNELVRNVLLALLSSLAKVEAKKISERTRAGGVVFVGGNHPVIGRHIYATAAGVHHYRHH